MIRFADILPSPVRRKGKRPEHTRDPLWVTIALGVGALAALLASVALAP